MAKVASREDRFTETKTVAMLTQPLVLKGTLAYARPDRVEKHVTSPYTEHLVVQGDQLTLSTREGTKRMAVNSHPLIRSFIEAIRASLAGEARRPEAAVPHQNPGDPAALDADATTIGCTGGGIPHLDHAFRVMAIE